MAAARTQIPPEEGNAMPRDQLRICSLTQPGTRWQPLPPGTGQGRLEYAQLFPGVLFSHLYFEGTSLPHHHPSHGSALELTHCRRGRVGWQMQTALYLGPGDLALYPRDCCAHSTLRFPLGHYEGFSLSLDPARLADHLPPVLAQAGVSPHRLLADFCPQGKPVVFPAQPALEAIFLPLYDLPAPLRLPYYTLKVQELLLTLPRLNLPAGDAPQYPAQQVETVRIIHDRLMAHPDQRITIEALAREYHLNASTLKAVFKGVYGQPIAAHMKRHRMEEAARLLRETDRSVGEIAQQVGYENQSKFSTVFRERYRLLPTEYRRQHRGQASPDRQKEWDAPD